MSDKRTFGVIVEKLSFLNKLSLLSDALADTEEPTPGYMYKEIGHISQESGAYCADLLEYLVSQLSSKSYNVKYKVLKILRYVVENGSPDFKEGLRKQSLGITDAIQFSGPPHPSRGMEPYLKVRREAVALSEELFSVTESGNYSQTKERPSQLQLGGMGSSGQGMMGFGNVTNKSKSSIVSSVRDLAEKVLSPPKSISHVNEESNKKFGDYQPASLLEHLPESGFNESSRSLDVSRSHGDRGNTMEYSYRKTTRKKQVGRKKGVAGGGWADTDEEEQSGDDVNVSTELSLQTSSEKSTPTQHRLLVDTEDLTQRLQQVQTTETSAEERLVDDITMDTDTYIMSHDLIKDFTKQCSMLNCDIVLEKLATKLKIQEDYVQMRSMLLLEGLLRTDYVSADQIVSVCSEGLRTVHNIYNRDRRKAKARKILRILEKLSNTKNLLTQDKTVKEIGCIIPTG